MVEGPGDCGGRRALSRSSALRIEPVPQPLLDGLARVEPAPSDAHRPRPGASVVHHVDRLPCEMQPFGQLLGRHQIVEHFPVAFRRSGRRSDRIRRTILRGLSGMGVCRTRFRRVFADVGHISPNVSEHCAIESGRPPRTSRRMTCAQVRRRVPNGSKQPVTRVTVDHRAGGRRSVPSPRGDDRAARAAPLPGAVPDADRGAAVSHLPA